MQQISERVGFLKSALRDHKVGALTMSSDYVIADALTRLPKDARVVVEYGPGSGVLTRAILGVIPSDARLIAVEPNGEFVRALETIADPRLTIIPKTAQGLSGDDLARMQGADAIVASMPAFYLSPSEREKVAGDAFRLLRQGGVFVVSHQYTWLMRKPIMAAFGDVAIRFEPRNLFPCFILSAEKR